MSRAEIWVVDDDDDHREGLCDLISAAGHHPVGLSGVLPRAMRWKGRCLTLS
ncbi:hypothetical protein ACFQFQ_22920 [Sulfitobacter porphyrae]|uniref:Response regulatory domain-containing protein n=1 Tax=Sulfitobacter porphyrae TaxID=1246864 RepID=A0ABW2B7T9_9RHOB